MRLRVEKACWTLRKLCCRAFNTTFGEWPAEYKTVSSAYKWIVELPTAWAMLLMQIEKSLGPRIEPWGTPLVIGSDWDSRCSDFIHSLREVVSKPGQRHTETPIRLSQPTRMEWSGRVMWPTNAMVRRLWSSCRQFLILYFIEVIYFKVFYFLV